MRRRPNTKTIGRVQRWWRRTALALVAACALAATPAAAQEQPAPANATPAALDAPALDMGAEIEVSALDNEQYMPAAAYNSKHNEYLVVWHNSWGGGYRDIYAQRVSAGGELKSWFAVTAGTNSRAQPAVAYDPVRDRYLVVWAYDVNGNGSNWDIYGRFIPWNGPDNAMGEFVICDWSSSQMYPDIAYAAAQKEFLVVWTNLKFGAVPAYVSARRVFGGGGFPNTKGFTVASDPTDVRIRPDVTYNLARNEYFVAFDNDVDIFGARLTGTGALLAGGEFKIAGWPDQENVPSVAACAGVDQYLVVWQSLTASKHEVYGYLLAGDGAKQKVFRVHGSPLEEENPEIVCDATGRNYLVLWEQEVGLGGVTQGWGLRRVHPNGSMEGVQGFIGDADLSGPALTAGRMNSLVMWEQARSSSAFQDIHACLLHMERLFLPQLVK